MKLYIFIFILSASFMHCQGLQVIYEISYNPIKNNPKKEKELMALEIDKNNSVFYSYAKVISDSLYQKINIANEANKNYLRSILPSQSFNEIIVKNYLDKKDQVIERFNGEYFSYPNSFNGKWEIQKSSKIINNYNCTAAKLFYGGRIWEAWFTNDIPIQDGPFLFQGLPGLILQISSDDGDYFISSKSILKKKSTFELPSKIVTIKTLNKLIDIKKNYIRDPSAKSRQEDAIDGISGTSIINGVKFNAVESYKFLNNELWNWMKLHNNPLDKTDIWVR
ncbi:GLPGLI family protein [Halpernia frigidisoli]|uniref:GLPGLI family protein n=1 Tax=Halpernia frigidisoli TaxID=1125876 RepID=A0A1I3FZ11_9FLAO|nr:GLPGLI family protein [Halpernia frigidisoli]SFI16439.1 GLPGLI family protein [Halpernia frigidisoli]